MSVTVLERDLCYHRKQIEKLVYAVDTSLEQHITAETCALLENAEVELNQLRAAYAETVQQILRKCSDEEFEGKCDALTDAMDVLFDGCRMSVAKAKAAAAKFKGNKARESLAMPSNSTEIHASDTTSVPSNQYPKIKIPSFDGDYRQFMRFKGIFVNLVHEESSIPNVRKLYYLQSALEGDAAKLIEDLPIVDGSYEEAWSRITARYDNQKALVMIYFRELTAIKPISSSAELRSLLDTVTNALNNLKLCQLPADNWGDLVAYMVYQCLDSKTKDDFDNSQSDSSKFFGWKILSTFLKGRAYSSEMRQLADNTKAKFTLQSTKDYKSEKKKPATKPASHESKSSFVTVTREKCIACSENHLLIVCPAFATKTPKQRFELVQANRMCSNCFSRSHAVKKCSGSGNCKLCGQRHHTLLHFPKRSSIAATPADASPVHAAPAGSSPSSQLNVSNPEPEQRNPAPTSNLVRSESAINKVVVLPTAVVIVSLANNQFTTVRILIDNCSQVNFVSEKFVRRNRITARKKTRGHRSFTGATDGVVQVNENCSIFLKSRVSDFHMSVIADVVPEASLKYAMNGVTVPEECAAIKGFQLADPALAGNPLTIPPPEILLGAEYFEKCMLNETRVVGSLTLRKSVFGWIVIGPIYSTAFNYCTTFEPPPLCLTVCQIAEQLRKFWELEDVEQTPNMNNDEKSLCEKHFVETHTRGADGKFVISLPLKGERSSLANNFVAAQRNLWWSEKARVTQVQPEYIEFMREYEEMGHMTRINAQNELNAEHFIPHHAVLRPSSTTTATRVVFNASSKTISGLSLNDLLMVGPTIQPELMDTLLQFRLHCIAFTADIAKMYRCIWVREEDRPLQCVLWRESVQEPIAAYQLNTLTYGTSCAPYVATKCLQVIAKMLPEGSAAASAMVNHFYMDDLLSGSSNLPECIQLQRQIHEALETAGFVLRKYQSNSPKLLESIDSKLVERRAKKSMMGEDVVNILGISWLSESDTFSLQVNALPKVNVPVTRCFLLSETSKTFDPLGFVAPFTIRAKIFMRKVWKESTSWDEPLGEELASEFQKYRSEMSELEKFQIPRPYSPFFSTKSSILVGFCDASEAAYCAVLYMQSTNHQGEVSVNFVCAKTRVAPLKPVSIPRLELQAAWLLAQLASRVSRVLNIELNKVKVFSDSQVVLSWLAKPPSTWTVFVKNRVAKIVEFLPFVQWSYVKTSENPADLATRGLAVHKFLNSKLWVRGPEFLTSVEPFSSLPKIDEHLKLEKREKPLVCGLTIPCVNDLIQIVSKFSSFRRLVRVFAFVLKFVNGCLSKNRSKKLTLQIDFTQTIILPLSSDELLSAEARLIFIVQYHSYFEDFQSLFQGLPIKKGSSLRALDPFLDGIQSERAGSKILQSNIQTQPVPILRVGGRLRQADLPFARKHPVILPAKCHFVELLILHLHTKFFHAQRSFLLAHLRPRFWFQGNLTNVVKKCIRRCVICRRYDSATASQIMGDLPTERVSVSRPFTRTGVDFAGPFIVKCVGHRSTVRIKSYVAIFVCLSTRAVHLEVVSQLSTDHFLLSLSRFIGRRGRPSLIWSDNGTNFVGAAACLNLSDLKVGEFMAEHTIQWIFNPPRAPHRGGIWESAVKSMKKHLIRSTCGQTFTFEELSTVLCKIESVLNSRPLITKADQNQEKLVLTPAHFLVGDTLLSDPVPTDGKINLAKRFEIVHRVTCSFWRIWSRDYLSQLQSRYKWQSPTQNLPVGAIVLLRDEVYAPSQWPMGRITKVLPDSMGRVRTVEVEFNGTVKKRAITSLVPLLEEVSDPEAQPGEC